MDVIDRFMPALFHRFNLYCHTRPRTDHTGLAKVPVVGAPHASPVPHQQSASRISRIKVGAAVSRAPVVGFSATKTMSR
jgi:hypothetical protein